MRSVQRWPEDGMHKWLTYSVSVPKSEIILFFVLGFLCAFCSTYFGTTDLFDLSVNFQTAQKMVAGERLYHDFYIPNGPIAAVLLIPFAYLFSPGWALLLSSGILNGLACVVMHTLLSRANLTRSQVRMGTVLTAFWFLPPMGAFYHDHLAYLFVLCALFPKTGPFFLALAIHTKITVGVPAVLVWLISEIYFSRKAQLVLRQIVHLILWTFLFFVCWYFLFDWDGFVTATWKMPKNYFGPFPDSLWNIIKRFGHSILLPFRINPIRMFSEQGLGRLAFYPVVIATYGCLYHLKKGRLLAELLFTSLLCGSLLGRSFSHLFFGLGGAVCIAIPRRSVAAVLLVCAVVLTHHDRGMSRAKTTGLGSTALAPLSADEFYRTRALVILIEKMRQSPGSYYLTDNEAPLIPLALGFAPLNGCLDYHEGTGIPTSPEERLLWQQTRAREIGERKPRYVVWNDLRNRYRLIEEYLHANYLPIQRTEIFTLFERRPSGVSRQSLHSLHEFCPTSGAQRLLVKASFD